MLEIRDLSVPPPPPPSEPATNTVSLVPPRPDLPFGIAEYEMFGGRKKLQRVYPNGMKSLPLSDEELHVLGHVAFLRSQVDRLSAEVARLSALVPPEQDFALVETTEAVEYADNPGSFVASVERAMSALAISVGLQGDGRLRGGNDGESAQSAPPLGIDVEPAASNPASIPNPPAEAIANAPPEAANSPSGQQLEGAGGFANTSSGEELEGGAEDANDTNDAPGDKRARAVAALLADPAASNGQLAERASCSGEFIRRLRHQLTAEGKLEAAKKAG